MKEIEKLRLGLRNPKGFCPGLKVGDILTMAAPEFGENTVRKYKVIALYDSWALCESMNGVPYKVGFDYSRIAKCL